MTFQPKIGGLQATLAAEKRKQEEALVAQQKEKGLNQEKPFEYAAPATAKDKIRIIFDDSGSMGGVKITDAQDGIIEFMRNCVVNQTAVAIHPMNYGRSRYGVTDANAVDLTNITTNMPAISILVKEIGATGSTPLFQTLQEAIKKEPKATRYIVFSDGCPDDSMLMAGIIEQLKSTETKCDTVLITEYPDETSRAYLLMKELAEKTGGLFLVFDRNKVNFKNAFKYLAPGLRLQLAASVSMQQDLQAGKLK